ncbi:TolC family protein [Herbaspirillum sp. RTI4]|uniref:TolC family protein n=1 Tax=Herbaspirillum sp. RTI4 TaxID=3048640 RepID=UPI002AB3A6A7|nr:TolC family protein [Herbaspirillum sp. RTI4]MDY7579075.1 TolC family protein [Herbaspirillum sp. RTI4]MEA9982341.1 TolC family protein [Herbaspirillum sp. RTI4]
MSAVHSTLRSTRSLAISGLAVVLLAGCASFSQDGGFNSVATTARERLKKEVMWSRSDADQDTIAQRVAELLSKPLSVDAAVQLALLNNRGLQAAFADLAISESDLVQAGRLPNPRFAMLRGSQSGPDGREYSIEQAITFNLFSLVTMPQVSAIERRRFEQTQRMVSLEMLRLASETRKTYYTALAAEQSVRYALQVRRAAEASAELARRMAQVGNFNKLQQAREQGFYADAALGSARAEQASVASREQLTRLLGLWGQQAQFTLPERLPDLPQAPNELPNVEQMAMTQRLDVQAIRLQTEALANNLGLTKTTRFINVLEFGPTRMLEGKADAGYKKGYEVSFELPLFDWGTAKVAKAEALYMQSLNIAAQTAINARSEVREAYQGYRSSYDIARHYRDEIMPIKNRISEENQLRYNGMLIGVFDLLADARAQVASVNSTIEALRDFWIAEADLEMALIGKPKLNPPTRSMAASNAD